jgi:4-azaleucine resistance transporter AzlC
MNKKTVALKAAFPHTLPVLTGFIFLGAAYGILMNTIGYGIQWTFLMSLFAFAGSAQYVAITFLTTAFNPLNALLMTLMINARHLFYGISMLEKYKDAGRLKKYLIFGMCDETFSILCTTDAPEDVDNNWFRFFVTLLNHSYWVGGSILGSVLGSMISFSTNGLEFVLTALFVVIFLEQWKNQKDHKAAITGLGCSILCLVIFGSSGFIIPSMILILSVLTLMRKRPEKIAELAEEGV